ncbi:Hypothetical predicted protein [Cloeon dipterum]|uniref:Chitin-binding type-2 domain-containing protein n=1 Tax=Cloeon dipterum TaxID=197152 RepID=A0A8S1CPF0_9INSE|nr:Hypothetical predicted protein [Cloeon dipterum]
MDARLLFCLQLLVLAASAQDTDKAKRQIFREQVLPHNGGKIPESAFRSDRLALNKLQKLGVAVPDGVSLDARTNSVFRVAHDPETEYTLIKILQEDEGRYVPTEGRRYPTFPRSVQSTYLLRPPIGSLRLQHHFHRALPGPGLSLGGATIEATAGVASAAPSPQQPARGYLPAYASGHLSYKPRLSPPTGTLASPLSAALRAEHTEEAAKPADKFNYGFYGLDADSGFQPSPRLNLLQPSSYSSFFTPTSAFSSGLVHVRYPFRNTYATDSFYGNPLDNSLAGRAAEDAYTAESAVHEIRRSVTLVCEGNTNGQARSHPHPNGGCTNYLFCLDDGRTAEYVCPEGSLFNAAKGACDSNSFNLDRNCQPLE